MNTKVLIIVPVYNVEQYLVRFIDSILAQSFSSWQMILVDDGSTDASGAICDEYAERYSNIYVIHQKNQGISGARNSGLESCIDAEYVTFLDSDDWVDPGMLEAMIKIGDGYDLIVCDVYDYYKYGEEEQSIPRNTWKDHSDCFVADKYYDIICKSVTMWNKLIKFSVIDGKRFNLKMTYGEDGDFMVRIIPNIKKAIIIPKPYYHYFTNRTGNVVSSGLNKKTIEFLQNSTVVYRKLAEQNQPTCGVFRVHSSVIEVFRKIDKSTVSENREYILECGHALRRTALVDRIRYILDNHFGYSFRNKLLFLFMCYFPYASIKLLKNRGFV